ncbi:MAG: cell envelope integrity protein TolA [Deltaproteobacteria bacterium]|nr:cell envelope integrity protein TolA [Deltaproteobacteria bacterium]
MAEVSPTPTISLRERSLPLTGGEERLPKWLTMSFVLHGALIGCMFTMSFFSPAPVPEQPVYTVDLIGGEKIGQANLGTELPPAPKAAPSRAEPEAVPVAETKAESKREKRDKAKLAEKQALAEEQLALKEKKIKTTTKPESLKERKSEAKAESASADSVRERLIQTAAERARARTESVQKASKGETLSAGNGEGEGAASLGVGGRGGPGIVKGIDFIAYQNRMLSTIKDNWAWVGQRSNLRVVVHFGVKDNGEIVGLKVVQPSGDSSYDESVLRALKKSSPLPAPPEAVRKEFADVELTFRPRDLGA